MPGLLVISERGAASIVETQPMERYRTFTVAIGSHSYYVHWISPCGKPVVSGFGGEPGRATVIFCPRELNELALRLNAFEGSARVDFIRACKDLIYDPDGQIEITYYDALLANRDL